MFLLSSWVGLIATATDPGHPELALLALALHGLGWRAGTGLLALDPPPAAPPALKNRVWHPAAGTERDRKVGSRVLCDVAGDRPTRYCLFGVHVSKQNKNNNKNSLRFRVV